jgi:hypothetical protein
MKLASLYPHVCVSSFPYTNNFKTNLFTQNGAQQASENLCTCIQTVSGSNSAVTSYSVGFEVMSVVNMKSATFWNIYSASHLTFRTSIPPPSFESNSNPTKKPAQNKQQAFCDVPPKRRMILIGKIWRYIVED